MVEFHQGPVNNKPCSVNEQFLDRIIIIRGVIRDTQRSIWCNIDNDVIT